MLHNISRITAKMMMILAWAIIMIHACVPHYHHDQHNVRGLVCESDMGCDCDHDFACCDHHHHDDPISTPNRCSLEHILQHLIPVRHQCLNETQLDVIQLFSETTADLSIIDPSVSALRDNKHVPLSTLLPHGGWPTTALLRGPPCC